ncbi:tail fiber domain-containing protein [Serratia grimesii]|uniref:tail fiber domain-containing protein n=1 Tax=Serratia grimesii TaxID=82995 RepID=UPI0039B1222F
MNNNLLTGVNLKVFYSSDVGNSSPSSSLLKQVNEIAAFPAVAIQNQAAKIETYDSDYTSVLMGDKSIEAFPITVNLIADDISHQYLTQAADNQSVLQVKVQYEEAEDQEVFILLNGYISSYSDSGDKDSAVTRSFIFTPETLVAQGIADVQPVLRQGDFGVGSNGVDTPQYQLPMAGNGFIQIPGTSSENPASANLIGVGLTNQGRESGFVISESGDLKLYARNSSTAWTRIYSSTEADSRYVQKTLKVNGHELSTDIDLQPSDIGLSDVTNNAQLKIASNLSDLSNVTIAKTNLGLDKVLNVPSYSKTESDSTFVPKTLKVNGHELSTDIILTQDDVGLSDVLNVPSYSKSETDSTFVPKNLKVNGHDLNTDIMLQPSDIGIIPLSYGGTAATTAAGARTNLGLGITDTLNLKGLSLSNSGDAVLNLNTAKVRANSNGDLIIGSSTNIYLRPNGDNVSSPQMIYTSGGNLTMSGTNVSVSGSLAAATLSISGVGNFLAGVNVLKTITIAPQSGKNTDWATIGFFDSSDAGAKQRGAVFSDKDGNTGLMNKAGNTVTYGNNGAFNISDGELLVGVNRGNNGEANDARDKGWLSNKGWLNAHGVNSYQEGGTTGQWIRQINGMRLLSQGTDIVSHEYLIQRTGAANAGHVINVTGGGASGTLELRNNANLYISGTNPTFYLGGAGMYADGNLSGTSWSNPSNAYLKTWLGLNGVSDIRMKEDFSPCEGNALDKIKLIEFVQFDWNDNNKPFKNSDHVNFGWKAQQLEEIDPGFITKQYGDDILNPDLSTILPLAFKAIQELNDENKALVTRIEKLENSIQQLLNK